MNPILHVEIPVTDLARAIAFYEAVFGQVLNAPVAIHGNQMAYFPFADDASGASVALAQGEIYVPGETGAVVYFGVDDVDAVLARAVAHGGTVLLPPTPAPPYGQVAEFRDSEGNRIAVQA